MELGIDDIPGEDDKKYKDGMQVGNVLRQPYLCHFFLTKSNPLTHPTLKFEI